MLVRLTVLMMLFLSFTATYSGTIDPKVSDNKYTEYAKQFDFVGKICGTYSNGTKFCASAVAIDDHHILTAAHVVKNSKECRFIINEQEFCLTNVIYHKDFETRFAIADIAIGYSNKPLGLKKYPELYADTEEIGNNCVMVGYGLTGTFHSGAKFSDNKKRAGTNMIDSIYEDLLVCSPSIFGKKDHTNLEFLIASGDSGGGLFINGKLAGIHSCVMAEGRSPNSIYGDESGHTRISKYIEWIKENKKQNE